ncbi:hypothetical protein [Mesorhizobium waimense]|nr:hypothetical protein [Mesorhizobium waimense]
MDELLPVPTIEKDAHRYASFPARRYPPGELVQVQIPFAGDIAKY